MYSAAIPQRADMVLERCTNAVATPFGVTGAITTLSKCEVCYRDKVVENPYESLTAPRQ